ncbi:50S ribosomal protein L9, partial [Bacteriovoracaceae bacterium]|nr:50S ribosomal protein L9 [Bacteriovoracaceae bacterium]
MKVILTEKVKALGSVGEIVNVSEGYARNFLIPQNVAVVADAQHKAMLENEQKRLAKKIDGERNEALDLKQKIDGQVISFTKKVGGNGKIFGTVTSSEISKEFAKLDIDVEKRLINVENPIKNLGAFEVSAKLFKG